MYVPVTEVFVESGPGDIPASWLSAETISACSTANAPELKTEGAKNSRG